MIYYGFLLNQFLSCGNPDGRPLLYLRYYAENWLNRFYKRKDDWVIDIELK